MSIFQRQLVGCLLISVLSISAYGQSEPGRNRSGYFGAVKSVRTETVEVSLEGGKFRRGKRKLDSIERFDKKGRLLEDLFFSDDGSILSGEKYSYDSQGRLVKSLGSHSRFVYLPDLQAYKYDAQGNVIEVNGFNSSGKLVNTDEYAYDEKNRKIQWTSMSYHPEEHSKPHRWTYSHDEQGRLKEELSFSKEGGGFKPTDSLGDPHRKLYIYKDHSKPEIVILFKVDGSFAGLESRKYDRSGNDLEEVEYDESGLVRKRVKYGYKFDRRGNWIQQNTYEWSEDNPKSAYQLGQVSYQIIRYF
jgi:hypothetical protein